MITAAAGAVSALSDATTRGASLLPPMTSLRTVSAAVAIAVAQAAETRTWPRGRWTIWSSRYTRRCGGRSIRRSKPSK
jgi:malic enzyme